MYTEYGGLEGIGFVKSYRYSGLPIPQLVAEPLIGTQRTDSGPILSRTLRGRITRRNGSLPVYVSSPVLHQGLF